MNILTIDTDFLFRDMEKIQASFDTDLTPKQSWQVVRWKNPNTLFGYHLRSFDFLCDIINKKVNRNTEIFKITEHDKVIPILRDKKVQESTIFNIDYHHDISYGDDDRELNIENWVLHAKREGLMNTYHWITQFDAKPCVTAMLTHSRIDWENVDIDKLPYFDIIIVCTSKHFTPPECWNISDKLVKMAFEVKTGIKGE